MMAHTTENPPSRKSMAAANVTRPGRRAALAVGCTCLACPEALALGVGLCGPVSPMSLASPSFPAVPIGCVASDILILRFVQALLASGEVLSASYTNTRDTRAPLAPRPQGEISGRVRTSKEGVWARGSRQADTWGSDMPSDMAQCSDPLAGVRQGFNAPPTLSVPDASLLDVILRAPPRCGGADCAAFTAALHPLYDDLAARYD